MSTIQRLASKSMLVGVGCVVTLMTACGGVETGGTTPVEASTTTTLGDLGGDRLPVRLPGEDYGQGSVLMTGTLDLESNGCWVIDLGDQSRLVIFPEGFDKPSDDGSVMVSAGGERYAGGDQVDAEGLIVAASTLPGGPDGFWGSYVGFCDGSVGEVVVLSTIQRAFDPAALSDEELRELLESAELSVSWGCGFGFQLSTEDQRVALRLHPLDMEETAPPASLPDSGWEAVVVIGKHLQVNNCDDVVEGWEPVPQVVATWPVTGGSFSFEMPTESGCGLAGSVTATLEDIVVESPSGDVELGDLTVVNEAYGCFAG